MTEKTIPRVKHSSQIKLDILQSVHQYFSPNDTPFLNQQCQIMRDKQPYAGLRLLHNVHITLSTLIKLEPLLLSGAEITVTATRGQQIHESAINLLKMANINFIPEEDLENDYDFCLDCCGELLNKITPRFGAIELTQTGSVKYKNATLDYPVISIDETISKNLENLLGTGDGFIRAFKELTKEEIKGQKFVLFGYGKVGKGVVKAISPYTKNIIIIEENKDLVEKIKEKGLQAFHISETSKIRKSFENAFCITTATGNDGTISTYFEKEDFNSCKYLANIGSEDEFGDKFSIDDVLFKKRPINFSLTEPTKIKFLDPIFYMHNNAIDFILSKTISSGFHAYPQKIDRIIFNKWITSHNEDISVLDLMDMI
ncbi:MAG: NAD-binding protein [Proteobacteria bacterium]|nr:NAD-binding protein [Pseudomonadota bacterium]